MDPILEEMQRAKDVQYGRFRSWVSYLCALVAAKDDEIATLKAQLTAFDRMREVRSVTIPADELAQDMREVSPGLLVADESSSVFKRGPGRPRKTEAVNG